MVVLHHPFCYIQVDLSSLPPFPNTPFRCLQMDAWRVVWVCLQIHCAPSCWCCCSCCCGMWFVKYTQPCSSIIRMHINHVIHVCISTHTYNPFPPQNTYSLSNHPPLPRPSTTTCSSIPGAFAAFKSGTELCRINGVEVDLWSKCSHHCVCWGGETC